MPELEVPAPASAEEPYLVRTRALIEAAIRRRWAQGLITRDADGVFTSYLGANEIEKLMRAEVPAEAELDEPELPIEGPFAVLANRMWLSPSEIDLLAVLLACESDPRCARLASYLGGNQTPLALTFELILEIVYRGRHARQSDAAGAAFRDLGASRPLRRLRYFHLDGAEKRVGFAQGIRLDGRIASWLLGSSDLDAELVPFARLYAPDEPLPVEMAPELVEPVLAAIYDGTRLIDLQGPRQSGRELVLRHAASLADRPLLLINGRGLGADRLVAAFREASLFGALIAFTDGDEALAGDAMLAFRNCLPAFGDSVALIGCRETVRALVTMRPTTTVAVAVPPFEVRVDQWRAHLGHDALDDVELQRVAAIYNLGISGIVNASSMARELAAFAKVELERQHVALAIRQLFDSDLSTIARRVEVTQTWDDLVLPEDVAKSVFGIVDRVQFRGQVLGDWGFARKLGKGLGLTVLFSGQPGTGKSMVAGLLAAELGLDLYVVDLSQITSKWLGETEKNLGRAFDAAEAGHVLLLFDEADSMLGRRTGEVRSANDRYANMETNFILARLEQFQGIAFFTTNLASAIDPAIERRMSVTVQFPYPDIETRELLWRRMIPAETPVSPQVDYAALARRYELSGGFIRNIVLRAAYLAARAGRAIEMRDLVEAAEAEYRDRGALSSGGRLV